MIYTPELIKSIAPAVFATSPSSKMTNKYEFVPTNEVMKIFDREGWKLSSVKQCSDRSSGFFINDCQKVNI